MKNHNTLIFLSLLSLILLVSVAGCSKSESQSSKEISFDSEWINLFNGEDLSGWIQRGGEAKYEVVDGQIVGTTMPDTPNSFLCTQKEYDDFILELEVMVDPILNSGIQIRSQSNPDYKDGRVHGYQVEIDPSDRTWSGGIYDEARRGWLDDLEDNPEARKAFKNGQWNHYKIRAVGDTIKTWVNGIKAANLVDTVDASGFIALQVHSTDRDDPLQVKWRNIRLKTADE